MNCNIKYKSDDSIDYVVADNGNKSELFEDLRNVVGDDNAVDYYALSKSQEFNNVINSKTHSEQSDNSGITYQTAEIKGVTSHMFVQDGEVVGSLRVKPENNGFKVDTVSVREGYRGQGVGTELYYETVRNLMIQGKKLYSDDSQTEFAHRIWKNLVKDGLAIRTGKFNFETVEPLQGIDGNTSIDDITISLKGVVDQNNEASVSEVLKFSNTSQESLSKAQTVDAIETATSFGVTNSTELNFLLEKVFIDNGTFVFDKNKMLNVGFSEYEVTKILNNPKLQKSIKDNFAKLKNTEFEINLADDLVPSDKLNSFGKQRLVPKEQAVQTEIFTITESGLELKQTDTKDTLVRTYPDNVPSLSEKFSKALRTAINVREDVAEENLSDIKTLARYISKEALDYGVDLRGLENKVFPVKRFSNFVSELAKYITNPNNSFSEIYDNFMETPQQFSNQVVNDNEFVLDTTLSELDIFENYNLVRKEGNVFTLVDSVSLEELVQNVQEPSNISELGLSEFNFNRDTAERLLLWKKFLGYNIAVEQNSKPEYIDTKELKSNPYKKATSSGIAYIDNSLLTKQKADVYETNNKVENLTREEIIRSNPDKVSKIRTDYNYIADGVLITKNNTEGFVRTPQGLFERFYESGDLSFFAEVENIKEKPLSNIDLTQFENNKSLITDFVKAKEYYTKKELEDINNKYFNCK